MPVYPDGYREFAYVANAAGDSVTVLDLVYMRQDRTVQVGADPTALALNPVRPELYVVNTAPGEPAGSVSVLSTETNQVVATIPVHRTPRGIVVDARGERAYVVNSGSDTISVLDLKRRRVLASYATGSHPAGLALDRDGRSLVVTNLGSGTISVYTPGAAVPLTPRTTFTGCPGASNPVIVPDPTKVFAACSSGHQVLVAGLAVAPDSWFAKQDGSLTADHMLALLDVGQHPTHLTLKPDGGEIFVSNQASDTVSEISTYTNEVGSTYPIGNRPTHGVVSGDNSALWVAASGADSISLYSIDDGKFVSSIRTGSSPDALAFSADGHLILAADSRSGDVAVIRTASKLGPALLTILPAGGEPCAIVVRATQAKA